MIILANNEKTDFFTLSEVIRATFCVNSSSFLHTIHVYDWDSGIGFCFGYCFTPKDTEA
jgi:hypothetical protein